MNLAKRVRPRANKLAAADRAGHGWYRFVLSFPPHLVRDYLARFEVKSSSRVLDPFCGTGTTLVECKKLGIAAVGVEAHPMAHFAAMTKTDWSVESRRLIERAENIAAAANDAIAEKTPLRLLPPESADLLLANSISPLPLHKSLVLIEIIRRHGAGRHEMLALAKGLVTGLSNLRFGPEVGVGPPKDDAPVVETWLDNVRAIADDLRKLRSRQPIASVVHHADSRQTPSLIEPKSIDAVITSPPYPNEKDYTRTTRLESVLLGFLHDRKDLRALKGNLMRSNTRNVYAGDDDDQWIAANSVIQRLAAQIEARRIEMGKTSGFERMYARVTRLYFGGISRHLEQIKCILKPGARLAYVVGDQASYLRIMIRTGQLLADIAAKLGYEVQGIDLFRTRAATATGQELREEVVILRWPG